MDRRVSGGLMLVMALLVALVVPKVLHPARVNGMAAMAPPPAPPVAGDCIDRSVSGWSVTGDGRLDQLEPVTLVSCGQPHGGEIVRVVAVAPTFDAGTGGGAFDDFFDGCWLDVLGRWPTDPEGWSPRVDIGIGIIGPDARQAAAGQDWAACTVGTVNGTLDRPLAAMTVDGAVPPSFGSCSTRFHQRDEAFSAAGCTVPHNHEDLGYRSLEPGSTLSQDAVVQSCNALAGRLTGRPDLPTDPALVVETEANAWYDSGESSVITLPLPADAAGGYVSCAVHAADDRMLTASLRQFGDGPLPFAP